MVGGKAGIRRESRLESRLLCLWPASGCGRLRLLLGVALGSLWPRLRHAMGKDFSRQQGFQLESLRNRSRTGCALECAGETGVSQAKVGS